MTYAVMTQSKEGVVLTGGGWKDKITWGTRLVCTTENNARREALVHERIVEYHSPAWNELLETVLLR